MQAASDTTVRNITEVDIGGASRARVDEHAQRDTPLEDKMKILTALGRVSLIELLATLLAFIASIVSAVADPIVRPADMNSGSLLLKAKDGYLEAPRVATDYEVKVSAITARTTLTQAFTNPADGFVEGIYVFPLPEGAAVDSLKIIVGNRVIIGEVKERQEAKIIYEEAKAAGQAASLVEQARPNMFTNSVANIGPHEKVVVQIEYQEQVRVSSGTFQLRLPLVVAPRYNPPTIMQSAAVTDGSGFGTTTTAPPQPPVLDPKKHDPINPVTINIDLNAGFNLGDVTSHHHKVNTTNENQTTRKITLTAGDVPADRDFELTWKPLGTAPQIGLFKETVQGRDYLLGLITPPVVNAAQATRPREMIFVIDNSGSMEGPSMQQAKDSLLYGLSQLKPQDRFNVIRFDDTLTVLHPTSVAADKQNIDQAKRFVESLTANGGTEMVPALKAALNDDGATRATHLRQLVFLTDGAIGNEQDFFSVIGQAKGRSRIFMVGIGSAPNSYLMTRAAEIGRGTFTQIGDGAQVTDRMRDLFTKISQPVITELNAKIDGANVTLTPETLPDLYAGEPVMLMAETEKLDGTLTVTGKIGDQPWTVTLPLNQAATGKGLSKLWARRKLDDFEVKSILGQLDIDTANKEMLRVALAHQIVSSQTSLIAVDKTPKRPPGQLLTRAEVPLNLPAGWDFDKVFGTEKPVLERDAKLNGYTKLAVLDQPQQLNAAQQVQLPQTATPAGLLALLGTLMMLLASLTRWLAGRKVKPCAAS
jgi:Ca-activated chloride channel homolog